MLTVQPDPAIASTYTRVTLVGMKTAAIAGLLAVLAIGGALSAFAATRTVETSVDLELELWVDLQTSSAYVSTRQEGHEWITHDVRTALSRPPPSRPCS